MMYISVRLKRRALDDITISAANLYDILDININEFARFVERFSRFVTESNRIDAVRNKPWTKPLKCIDSITTRNHPIITKVLSNFFYILISNSVEDDTRDNLYDLLNMRYIRQNNIESTIIPPSRDDSTCCDVVGVSSDSYTVTLPSSPHIGDEYRIQLNNWSDISINRNGHVITGDTNVLCNMDGVRVSIPVSELAAASTIGTGASSFNLRSLNNSGNNSNQLLPDHRINNQEHNNVESPLSLPVIKEHLKEYFEYLLEQDEPEVLQALTIFYNTVCKKIKSRIEI